MGGLPRSAPLRECVIWTTKDGRVVALVDMSNDHLVNVIRFTRRRAVALKCLETARLTRLSSAAAPRFARVAYVERMDIDEYCAWRVRSDWPAFVREARRRKLEVPELTVEEESTAMVPGLKYMLRNLVCCPSCGSDLDVDCRGRDPRLPRERRRWDVGR